MYKRNDWPKHQSVIDDSKDNFPNICVVNVNCGQCHCKFQLTAYTYYDPEDFNPEQDVRSPDNGGLQVRS